MNIAVFCSGNGSNFQAILESLKTKDTKAKLALMVCDNPESFALERAKKEGIKSTLIQRKNFKTKVEFENEIIAQCKRETIELICLAGYMRIVGPTLINAYKNRIINIHPALLPSFKGAHGIADALSYGVKTTGVSVHFVDKEMDHGPIISQRALDIVEDDTQDSLAQRIHALEHELYPQTIKLFAQGKLTIQGRKVKIG